MPSEASCDLPGVDASATLDVQVRLAIVAVAAAADLDYLHVLEKFCLFLVISNCDIPLTNGPAIKT